MHREHERIQAPQSTNSSFIHSFWGEVSIAMLGIVIGQAILYGPMLIGKTILLPLNILAFSESYLPHTDQYKNLVPHNVTLADLVFFIEPERLFVNSELRAGRFPLWTPHRFAGAPLFTLGLSLPWLPAYLISSPIVLAWTQMLIALIAGMGMYYFCRRILVLGPWPSVIAAWCYPVTGAYVLWIGQWLPAVMCWLPWSLAAVNRAVRRPRGWGGPALCGVTIMLLIGGAIDIAGQVLLVSGLYALWCIWDEYHSKAVSGKGFQVAAILLLSWTVGFACSFWLLLPMNEYVRNGSRMTQRSDGSEERPPIGLSALPQIAIPDMYGSWERGSYRIDSMVLPESSAAMYAGSAALLVLAPLAWFSRRRRSVISALGVMAFFSLSWTLNITGIVQLLRLPGLNMMSHNRLVFVGAFAIIALAAIGLEVLLLREASFKLWFSIPAILLAVLCGWCFYRSMNLPEPIANELSAQVAKAPVRGISKQWEVEEIQQNYRKAYAINAVFCGLGATTWGLIFFGFAITPRFAYGLAALLLIQLFYFGYDFAAQASPGLHFPKIPILERIADSPPGRIIGFGCLPANLAQSVGLSDVRGYDGVDPRRIVALLKMARNPQSVEYAYAATQYLKPAVYDYDQNKSLRLHPVLDMLGVRYVIFRGVPPSDVKPLFVDSDYWVLENKRAMPRAFIPRRLRLIADEQERLKAMSPMEFDPQEIAYVEQPVAFSADSEGAVDISDDNPQCITMTARMKTPGMVVLADRWDKGWRGYINNREVPIMRVNHALRGVPVDSGISTIRFVYSPASLKLGLVISAAGGICWLVWAFGFVQRNSKQVFPDNETPVSPPKRLGSSSSLRKGKKTRALA
jgi:hypothetical protein